MSEPGAESPRGTMTYADYAVLPDDGRRYQLVEGELIVAPAPTTWHQLIQGEIYYRLRIHVDAKGLGHVLGAPLDVVLDDRNVLQPDVLFVSNERAAVLERKNVQGPPDLVVEVLSPGTERLDRVRKLGLYGRFGAAHYWIVDIDARAVEEYVLHGDVHRARSVTPFDEPFRPVLFPGFELRLGAVVLPA